MDLPRLRFNSLPFLFGLLIILVSSCKDHDEDPKPQIDDNPNADINNWIYDVMDEVYYWTDEMPENPDLTKDPLDFFDDLLYSGDRFSVIVEHYDDLVNSLEGVTKEAGYEFALYLASENSNDVVAEVLYVKHDSPAESAGLLRGDFITAINGTTITTDNYQDLLADISENHTISFERLSESGDLEAQSDLDLTAVELQEDPNYLSQVITLDNDRKVGYFVYNFFSPGPGTTVEFDDEMDDIFGQFKSAAITDLVVDLRYNSGGALTSATNLASLIAPNIDDSKIFYENRWNDLYQEYIESLDDGDDILRGKFQNEPNNVGSQLTDQTVYLLVGSRTASASELIINGLSPYMNVVLIGETTIGKNVGSIPVNEEDNPDNDYGLLPIAFRVYNSAGESDYADGFTPVGNNFIEENTYYLEPLGDPNDPLLATALQEIAGQTGDIGGRKSVALPAKIVGQPIKYSLDDKLRSNKLIMDPNMLLK